MTTTVVNIKNVVGLDYIYIGRPSKWGNPIILGPRGDRVRVCMDYAKWLLTQEELLAAIPVELKDKLLGCHCAPDLCHGNILAKVADNGPAALTKWIKDFSMVLR